MICRAAKPAHADSGREGNNGTDDDEANMTGFFDRFRGATMAMIVVQQIGTAEHNE